MKDMASLQDTFAAECGRLQVMPPDTILAKLKGFSAKSGMWTLNLSAMNPSGKVCQAMIRTFQSRPESLAALTDLDLANGILSNDCIRILLDGFLGGQGKANLQVVDLRGCRLDGQTMARLGDHLQSNKTILRLNLEWNEIGLNSECFSAFCAGLKACTSLAYLNLSSNRLSNTSAKVLSGALRENVSLKMIDLRWNDIGSAGAADLLDALKWNTSLVTMDLEGNRVPQEIVKTIERSLFNNSERQVLIGEFTTKNKRLMDRLRRSQEARADAREEAKAEKAKNATRNEETRQETAFQIGQLKAQLASKEEEISSLREKKDYLEKAVVVAESQLESVLEQDKERQEHLHHLQANWRSYEETLKQEWLAKESKFLVEIKELNELLAREKALGASQDKELAVARLEASKKILEADRFNQMLEEERQGNKDHVEKLLAAHENDLERTRSSVQREMAVKMKEKVTEMRHMEERMETLLLDKNTAIQDLEKDQASLHQEKARLEEQHREALMKANEVKNEMEKSMLGKMDKMSLNIQKQSSQIEAEKQTIARMREELATLSTENEELKELSQDFEEQKLSLEADLRKKFEKRLAIAAKAEKDLAESQAQCQGLAEELDECRHSCQQLVKTKDKEINRLKQNAQDVKDELDELRQRQMERSQKLMAAIKTFTSNDMS